MRSPRVGPWGPNVRGDVAARGAPGVAVEPVLCGVMAGSLLGGSRGQTAFVHIRSGGRDRQAECAEATGRRCVGSHERAAECTCTEREFGRCSRPTVRS